MNGAQALIHSLVDAGVDVCFMNPGTSEMHFVHALDAVPAMRGVLAMFEGVATGAADGWARVTGRPAAVLLHLGPGLGNGLANLHNARRAHSPVLCVVGAHATGHVAYDAPLQSDIESSARTVSGWVHTSGTSRSVAADAMRALEATGRDGGQVATLVLPADVSWSGGGRRAPRRPAVARTPVEKSVVDDVVDATGDGDATMLLLGGAALTERGLRAASRISRATGTRLLVERFVTRMEAGAGVPTVRRQAYPTEHVRSQLDGVRRLVLAGTPAPVAFFAYPGLESDHVPAGCEVIELADVSQDVETALESIADRVAAGTEPQLPALDAPEPEPGPLTVAGLAAAVAATLPENAVVVDEGLTSSMGLPPALATANRHTLLTLTGGAIGQGLPAATGAAVGAPDRPVLSIEADGSALYTIQALWTQARERLDVTTVIVNNAAYAILRAELARTRAGEPAERASRMLDLSDPTTDFVSISRGFGVPARKVTTAQDLVVALREAYAEPGPHLVEAIVPPVA
ncbi:acetolactate synthase large subunit [Pseudonocardia sp. KRD291]|uniref:acetolactate synthase large subunit n=1 Tax=Pseudonocardia sp. KRD291 TaxID=2792007 RepID=UPI001C4A2D35|nr:acetolactate synthase large subunit [Pseudonocardia sp. KRD291]MBW0106398.1 acetolactate synthase large subunit [Pseudonocardia sp. KRD291]